MGNVLDSGVKMPTAQQTELDSRTIKHVKKIYTVRRKGRNGMKASERKERRTENEEGTWSVPPSTARAHERDLLLLFLLSACP